MENLARAAANIRHLNRFRTRRTSIDSFFHCLVMIRDDHNNARMNNGDLLPVHVLRRLYRHVIYTFRMLRQRSTTGRRFPRNSEQVWAYYCIPLEVVANQLDVSEDILRRRALSDGYNEWPVEGDMRWIRLAVQYWNGFYFQRRIFSIPRNSVVGTLLTHCRAEFHLNNNTAFMLYYESSLGESSVVPLGPIVTNEDWRAVADLQENFYRVSLLMVLSRA